MSRPTQGVAAPTNGAANNQTIVVEETTNSFGSKFKAFFTKDDKKKVIVLSDRDAEILRQVKHRAKVLDTGVNLGFAKFGLDPIIGLIPVAGDVITLMLALRVVHTAEKAGIPRSLRQKMLFNICVDFGLGMVPLVGDIGDFFFKANDRNATLFEEFIFARAAQQAEETATAAAAAARLATPATTATTQAPSSNTKKAFGLFGQNNHNNSRDVQMAAVV